MDYARDGKGGIEGMLHKEYGVGNGAVDGNLAPLVDDTRRLNEIPPWTLGMVEIGYEIDGVSMTIDMAIQ